MSPETLAAFARVMFATFGGYVMSRPQLSAGTLSPPSAVVKSRSAADRMRFSVRRRILPPPGTIPSLKKSTLSLDIYNLYFRRLAFFPFTI